MRDPCMRLEILELVILDILFGIADQLEDQEISSVREDEGALFAERCVVLVVEPIGIPIDEFIFEIAGRKAFQSGLCGKGFQNIRLCAHDIAVHVRRTHLESRDVAIVVDMRLPRGQGHFEVRQDVLALEFGVAGRIQQGDLKEIIIIQDLARNTHLFRSQADGGDAAPFAVPAVLHLDRGFVDKPSRQRHGAGKAGHAAAAFFRRFRQESGSGREYIWDRVASNFSAISFTWTHSSDLQLLRECPASTWLRGFSPDTAVYFM